MVDRNIQYNEANHKDGSQRYDGTLESLLRIVKEDGVMDEYHMFLYSVFGDLAKNWGNKSHVQERVAYYLSFSD